MKTSVSTVGACLALLATACSADEPAKLLVPISDASSIFTPTGDASATRDGDPSGKPRTTLRLAHVAPDLGDLDFCYRATSSDPYIGPVLGGAGSPKEAGAPPDAGAPKDAGADAPVDAAKDADPPDASDAAAASDASFDATIADAGADAQLAVDAATGDAGKQVFLPYLGMTGYVALEGSGTFEIAIVDASGQGCSTPRLVGQVTLDAGRRSTVALMGREGVDASTGGAGGGSELALIAFTDNPAPEPHEGPRSARPRGDRQREARTRVDAVCQLRRWRRDLRRPDRPEARATARRRGEHHGADGRRPRLPRRHPAQHAGTPAHQPHPRRRRQHMDERGRPTRAKGRLDSHGHHRQRRRLGPRHLVVHGRNHAEHRDRLHIAPTLAPQAHAFFSAFSARPGERHLRHAQRR